MEKIVIRTENAPAPFQGAPYNQAICVGVRVVEIFEQHVLDEVGALASAPHDVVTQGAQERSDRPRLVLRHHLRAHLVGGGVERERERGLRLGEEPLETRQHT